MKSKLKCKKIQALLPLYCKNTLEVDKKELVEEHLKNCNNCKMKFELTNDFSQLNVDNYNYNFVRYRFLKTISFVVILTLLIFYLSISVFIPKITNYVYLSKKLYCEKAIISLTFFTTPLTDSINTIGNINNRNISIDCNYILNTLNKEPNIIQTHIKIPHIFGQTEITNKNIYNQVSYIKSNRLAEDIQSNSIKQINSEKEKLNLEFGKTISQVAVTFKNPLSTNEVETFLKKIGNIKYKNSWFVVYTNKTNFSTTDIWGFSTTVPKYRNIKGGEEEPSVALYDQPSKNIKEAENIFRMELKNLKKNVKYLGNYNNIKNESISSDIQKLIKLSSTNEFKIDGCILTAPTLNIYNKMDYNDIMYMKVLNTNFE